MLSLRSVCLSTEFVVAVITACVSGIVIVLAKAANPQQGAERYFMRHHKPVYLVLKLAHVVLFAAMLWNVRFIIGFVLQRLTA
jgi:hypothetical protein